MIGKLLIYTVYKCCILYKLYKTNNFWFDLNMFIGCLNINVM